EPADGGVVVVRARVDHRVARERVRQVRAAWLVEGELQHLHAGEPCLVAQRLDVRGDGAEVLGAERPTSAVSSCAGTSQWAAKARKWSMRTRSMSSRLARSRSIHQR